jgi:hypothetical protein
MLIGVWLGIPVLALIWAKLHLWRTRRLLKRLRHDSGVPEGGQVPAADAGQASSVTAA